VAAFDYGAKFSIFRKLVNHGFDVHVFPATATAEQVREFNPDAVFLSNGPGDPAALGYIHQTVTACCRLPDLRHLPRPPDAHARPRRHDL
jgi:carbamoyl-phosphate synthase small subunit